MTPPVPRPPRVRVAPSPEDRPAPDTLDVAVPVRQPPPRRLMMGELVRRQPRNQIDPTAQFTRRERAEKARQLLKGGRNRGAERGFGIARKGLR